MDASVPSVWRMQSGKWGKTKEKQSQMRAHGSFHSPASWEAALNRAIVIFDDGLPSSGNLIFKGLSHLWSPFILSKPGEVGTRAQPLPLTDASASRAQRGCLRCSRWPASNKPPWRLGHVLSLGYHRDVGHKSSERGAELSEAVGQCRGDTGCYRFMLDLDTGILLLNLDQPLSDHVTLRTSLNLSLYFPAHK